ncbi:outer membrane beta-barrel protein [Ferruginibacter paludis]|uniref:outer membrane beta-barrel protein n=1 Tax=Ferruginibacter paludis TaxID=1310417 RepID=UPI0025B56774|nr:outer membrane beta-barrel protein [Ferruginibacter paludis]MDN3655196.1 outer membrane beta-barrel protein [Ferruginibacter paludis]
MKKDLHNIDKLFKAALDDQTENPPESVWEAIDKRLDKNKVVDINKKYIQLKRIAVALLVLLLGFGAYTLNHWTKINSPSQADSTNHNKTNNDNKINSVPTSVDTKNKSAADTETVAVVNPAETDLQALVDSNKVQNANNILKSADGNKKQVTGDLAIAQKTDVNEEKSKPALNEDNQSINKKEFKALDNTVTPQQMLLSKRKAKATITNGGIDEVADEKTAVATIPTVSIPNKKTAQDFEIKNENFTGQQLTHLSPIAPQLISAPKLNAVDNRIASDIRLLPDGLGLTQRPGKRHTIKSGGGLSATLFFAPNISSNLLKEEPHERMPGGMPPPRDHDDRDKIRDGEQRQSSYSLGILLDYNLNKHWSLQTGMELTSKTITISPKTIYADKDDRGEIKYRFNCSSGYTYLSSKTVANPVVGDSLQAFGATNTLKYISVPLALKYHYYFNKIDLFALAGTTFNVLTKGKIATEIGTATTKEVTTSSSINGLKSNYFSGNIGLGLSYTITRSIALSFMPSYNFALNSSTRDATVKTYPNNISLAAGIRYKL